MKQCPMCDSNVPDKEITIIPLGAKGIIGANRPNEIRTEIHLFDTNGDLIRKSLWIEKPNKA